jgi:NAD-dependent DNA ligase
VKLDNVFAQIPPYKPKNPKTLQTQKPEETVRKIKDYECGKKQVRKLAGQECPVDKKYSDRLDKPDCCYATKSTKKAPLPKAKSPTEKDKTKAPTSKKKTPESNDVKKTDKTPNTNETKNAKKLLNLADHVVVFTGFRDKAFQDYIETLGGDVGSSITKKTTTLVYKNGGIQTKLNLARDRGNIEIIELSVFKSMISYNK